MEIIAVAAKVGIYGNSKQEALCLQYRVDADKQPLHTAKYCDALRFAPGQLPPVNAFWYVTMYELPSSLLTANVLNRYLINSPMLPNVKHDANGGPTIYVQCESSGKGKESNWLPASKGPFFVAVRLYWRKPEALDGRWSAQPLQHLSELALDREAAPHRAGVTQFFN